jgi:hypothetical protein
MPHFWHHVHKTILQNPSKLKFEGWLLSLHALLPRAKKKRGMAFVCISLFSF